MDRHQFEFLQTHLNREFPGRFATQSLSCFRIGSPSHLPILRPLSRNPAKLRLGIPKKAAGEGLSIKICAT